MDYLLASPVGVGNLQVLGAYTAGKALYNLATSKKTGMGFKRASSAVKKSRAWSAKSKAMAPKNVARAVKKIIDSKTEKKEISIVNSIGTAALNTTQSNLYLLNGIAEGTEYNTRIGRKVNHYSLEVDLSIFTSGSSAGTLTGDAGFWAVVLDRQPVQALPAFGDIFDDSLTVGVGRGVCFRNTIQFQQRFQILAREEWATGGVTTTAAASGAAPYHCKRFIDLSKLKGRDAHMVFALSTGVIAAIDYGCIYFVIASCFSSSSMTTQWLCNTKYRFTDA